MKGITTGMKDLLRVVKAMRQVNWNILLDDDLSGRALQWTRAEWVALDQVVRMIEDPDTLKELAGIYRVQLSGDELAIGQRVKLTERGLSTATRDGVRVWQEEHGMDQPITGTIHSVKNIGGRQRYIVKMDGSQFDCLHWGDGFNSLGRKDIEPIE